MVTTTFEGTCRNATARHHGRGREAMDEPAQSEDAWKETQVPWCVPPERLVTIRRYLTQELGDRTESKDLILLLQSIATGCKYVSSACRQCGLADLVGESRNTNVQGEKQKKLDVLANEVFKNSIMASGLASVLVSEEEEEAILVKDGKQGNFCIVFDPLDGSSNIDCGVSVGSIFGIYHTPKDLEATNAGNASWAGRKMVAAGYCLYGTTTILVLAPQPRVEVVGFTLDPCLGEFVQTHAKITIPEEGHIYSINEGNSKFWNPATAEYVNKCKLGSSGMKPKTQRYVGSMVADVHRTLLYGGIFMYPSDSKNPNGKLHVLYECFPMAFLTECAGGVATTGHKDMLDHQPLSLHERSPLYLGSRRDVERVIELHQSRIPPLLVPANIRSFITSGSFIVALCSVVAMAFLAWKGTGG